MLKCIASSLLFLPLPFYVCLLGDETSFLLFESKSLEVTRPKDGCEGESGSQGVEASKHIPEDASGPDPRAPPSKKLVIPSQDANC